LQNRKTFFRFDLDAILCKVMSTPIITAENLAKRYLVGHRAEHGGGDRYTNLRDEIGRGLRNFARKAVDVAHGRQVVQGDDVEEFWALKDVSFEVQQGEVVGFIGRNGAGKSTLLKILSRITEPTLGRVTLRGRVASLLEVGTGFHPELTGRENIYLNGAILGMTSAEIRRKFEEIVAFAEVERFLDTPVKRYSSGMYVRLAFAVAAHLEPEILIVDEVLAVGDSEFQKKCLGKMNDVSRREGRTVLLVSHNMGAIRSLCPRAIWLNEGSVQTDGNARTVIDNYLIGGAPSQDSVIQLGPMLRPIDDDRLRLRSLEWLTDLPLRHGEPVKARIRFKTRTAVQGFAIGIGFSNREGARLLTYDADFQDGFRPDIPNPAEYSVDVAIDALPLTPDIYNLDIGCRSGDSHTLDYISACSQVEVIAGANTPGYIIGKGGTVRLPSDWSWDFTKQLSKWRHGPLDVKFSE
jgi:lipopolysaccharide transport system ATP-binding protein